MQCKGTNICGHVCIGGQCVRCSEWFSYPAGWGWSPVSELTPAAAPLCSLCCSLPAAVSSATLHTPPPPEPAPHTTHSHSVTHLLTSMGGFIPEQTPVTLSMWVSSAGPASSTLLGWLLFSLSFHYVLFTLHNVLFHPSHKTWTLRCFWGAYLLSDAECAEAFSGIAV